MITVSIFWFTLAYSLILVFCAKMGRRENRLEAENNARVRKYRETCIRRGEISADC